MREHGSFLDDLKDLHRWMTEINSDNEHQYGPGLFDFHGDYSGSVLRAAIARLIHRIFRNG
jgi:hypothetical protein